MAAGQDLTRAGAAPETRASRWPARLDLIQSLTGLALAAFLGVHLLLDSAILFGPEAANWVAKFFEGEPFFGRGYPGIVSAAAAGLLILIVVHAALALRKFPHDYRQYHAFRAHMGHFRHGDTRLWWWQVVTGFLLFFLAAPHLYVVITQPEAIGAVPSARRVFEGRAWLLYALLLPAALFHAAAGVYRLTVKWGWPSARDGSAPRAGIRRAVWGVAFAYLAIGVAALGAYVGFGMRLAG